MESSGFLTPAMKSAQLPFNPLLFLEQEYREYGAESSHCLLLAASFALGGDAVPEKTQKCRHCEHLPSTRVQLQLGLATGSVQEEGLGTVCADSLVGFTGGKHLVCVSAAFQ